jgi:hypothetical protein
VAEASNVFRSRSFGSTSSAEPLQDPAYFGDLDRLFHRYGPHSRAAVSLEFDEALEGELLQRNANRCSAGVQLVRQLEFHQALLGCVVA